MLQIINKNEEKTVILTAGIKDKEYAAVFSYHTRAIIFCLVFDSGISEIVIN